MHRPMEGVRVLEVAQFTFVPAAGAVLADWGADVIKVEHPVTGDAQRGLSTVLGMDAVTKGSSFLPIMEGPNRGKRSIGLALDTPESKEILAELIRNADVFLTNYLPQQRAKLGFDLDDVRAINPDIIYVRGSGFGQRGPEATKGGYDSTGFWARGGSAHGVTAPDADTLTPMPSGAYGDSMGGMTIAGGVAAALYARKMTGETSIVDVSLLSLGAWATSFNTNLSMMAGGPLPQPKPLKNGTVNNPLVGGYKTSDGRWIMLTMLQPGVFWPEFCQVVGRPELATDERFNDTQKIMANAQVAAPIVAEIMASRTYAEWLVAFKDMKGPWAAVQDAWDIAHDESVRANGWIAQLKDADGVDRELVTSPVQFDAQPIKLTRAPLHAEHTDDILRELGKSEDELIELKIAGVVT